MEALARAVIHSLAFLELSDDVTIDRDSAIQVLEMLASDLQKCTDEERAVLNRAINSEYEVQKTSKVPENVLGFYKELLANIGLDEGK